VSIFFRFFRAMFAASRAVHREILGVEQEIKSLDIVAAGVGLQLISLCRSINHTVLDLYAQISFQNDLTDGEAMEAELLGLMNGLRIALNVFTHHPVAKWQVVSDVVALLLQKHSTGSLFSQVPGTMPLPQPLNRITRLEQIRKAPVLSLDTISRFRVQFSGLLAQLMDMDAKDCWWCTEALTNCLVHLTGPHLNTCYAQPFECPHSMCHGCALN